MQQQKKHQCLFELDWAGAVEADVRVCGVCGSELTYQEAMLQMFIEHKRVADVQAQMNRWWLRTPDAAAVEPVEAV